MTDRYPRIYAMLKKNGHTPGKALEILIEAKRGDDLALDWIRYMRRWR